ncbi:hypothetical protein BSL78_09871 [Apostichopus japonicus]|uniref:Uncharacterized protein n=1 Tax=Stichopus japonicus TaxID=307972 RepID=A0A2G8KZ30_STIJA|nr:hypothetical protein BSL78_09871 [Apostichopus japonicus]
MGYRGFNPEYDTSINGGQYQPPVCRPPPYHPPMTPHKYLSEEKVSTQITNKSVVGEKASKRVRFDLSRNQVKTVSRYLIGGKCAISKPMGTNNSIPAELGKEDEQMIKDDLKKARETTNEVKQEMTSLASNIPDNIHSKANLLALKKKFLARCRKQKKAQGVVRSSEKVVVKNDTARDGCSNHHASSAKDTERSVTTRCEAICTTKQNAEKGRNCQVFHIQEKKENTVQVKCREGASKLYDRLKSGSDNVTSRAANPNGDLSSSKDQSKTKSHKTYLLAQKKKYLAKCRKQKKNQAVIISSEEGAPENGKITQSGCSDHLASCAKDKESSVTTRYETICTKQNAEKGRNEKVFHVHEKTQNTVQIKCHEGPVN